MLNNYILRINVESNVRSLPINIRLVRRLLTFTNTPAYRSRSFIAAVQAFVQLTADFLKVALNKHLLKTKYFQKPNHSILSISSQTTVMAPSDKCIFCKR